MGKKWRSNTRDVIRWRSNTCDVIPWRSNIRDVIRWRSNPRDVIQMLPSVDFVCWKKRTLFVRLPNALLFWLTNQEILNLNIFFYMPATFVSESPKVLKLLNSILFLKSKQSLILSYLKFWAFFRKGLSSIGISSNWAVRISSNDSWGSFPTWRGKGCHLTLDCSQKDYILLFELIPSELILFCNLSFINTQLLQYYQNKSWHWILMIWNSAIIRVNMFYPKWHYSKFFSIVNEWHFILTFCT